jgi:protein phosphatase
MIARAGDRLLVCSDGLHDLLTEGEIQAIIADSPAHEAVANLIAAAKRNGGHDNITVALVHVFVRTAPLDAASRHTREFTMPSQ